MKVCKGCRYLCYEVGYYCGYGFDVCVEHYTNPISGKRYKRLVEGMPRAEAMRAVDGACGPDRELYDTEWRAFKRWARALLNKKALESDETSA